MPITTILNQRFPIINLQNGEPVYVLGMDGQSHQLCWESKTEQDREVVTLSFSPKNHYVNRFGQSVDQQEIISSISTILNFLKSCLNLKYGKIFDFDNNPAGIKLLTRALFYKLPLYPYNYSAALSRLKRKAIPLLLASILSRIAGGEQRQPTAETKSAASSPTIDYQASAGTTLTELVDPIKDYPDRTAGYNLLRLHAKPLLGRVNLDEIYKLLRGGVDPNPPAGGPDLVLGYLCQLPDSPEHRQLIIDLITRFHADVDEVDARGRGALEYLCSMGNPADDNLYAINLLLAHGVSVLTADGQRALAILNRQFSEYSANPIYASFAAKIAQRRDLLLAAQQREFKDSGEATLEAAIQKTSSFKEAARAELLREPVIMALLGRYFVKMISKTVINLNDPLFDKHFQEIGRCVIATMFKQPIEIKPETIHFFAQRATNYMDQSMLKTGAALMLKTDAALMSEFSVFSDSKAEVARNNQTQIAGNFRDYLTMRLRNITSAELLQVVNRTTHTMASLNQYNALGHNKKNVFLTGMTPATTLRAAIKALHKQQILYHKIQEDKANSYVSLRMA